MVDRSNEQWVRDLTSTGAMQGAALNDLRGVLERSALFYIRGRLAGNADVGADEVRALTEDIAQEASLVVLARLETFRGEARFTTWAGSIALILAISTLRRRLWRDVSLDRLTDAWQEPASTLVPGNGWSNPQLATQRRAIWEVITEVVHSDLTPRQREVLDLIVLKGVHTQIVEERLDMSPSALYKMTHDARRKLKAGLAKRGYSTGEILSAFAAER
jgi:RNA polymerase sigma-70 factor (ECF subfamily)